MTYDATRNPFAGFSVLPEGPAANYYALTNDMIGAKELPVYGKSVRVLFGSGAPASVALVVVPLGENSDARTETLTCTATETLDFAVRRIVTVNGGATLPAGVTIHVLSDFRAS